MVPASTSQAQLGSQVILGREVRKGEPRDPRVLLKLTDRWARVGADGEAQGAEGAEVSRGYAIP
jgi:hypothetical protein